MLGGRRSEAEGRRGNVFRVAIRIFSALCFEEDGRTFELGSVAIRNAVTSGEWRVTSETGQERLRARAASDSVVCVVI